jgi:hypothetical protein
MKRNKTNHQARIYAERSIHYFENAQKAINNKEFEKAGEFLWGSVAQILKATAASKEIKLRNHAQLWNYAQSLSKGLGDESIYDTFYKANYLHTNFYEAELTPEAIIIQNENIKEFLLKMLGFIGMKDLAKEKTRR